VWGRIPPADDGTVGDGHGTANGEEARMHGLIAAAGPCTRLQDQGARRNKVLPDLGRETLPGNFLQFPPGGSRQLPDTFEEHVQRLSTPGYAADVPCARHRTREPAFHLRSTHDS
jgi:hypothetical protein